VTTAATAAVISKNSHELISVTLGSDQAAQEAFAWRLKKNPYLY
jgi:hypothetical protein